MAISYSIEDCPPFPVVPGVEIRHVAGWPGYAVGADGIVWSCHLRNGHGKTHPTWRVLKSVLGRDYPQVTPSLNGRPENIRVHNLVLCAFIGPRPEGMEARHLDGNPLNSALSNLCWGTPIENTADKRRYGRWGTKLTEDDVQAIRELASSCRQMDLATVFQVSHGTISAIITRRTWRHVA